MKSQNIENQKRHSQIFFTIIKILLNVFNQTSLLLIKIEKEKKEFCVNIKPNLWHVGYFHHWFPGSKNLVKQYIFDISQNVLRLTEKKKDLFF